jgi:hypothetical protein
MAVKNSNPYESPNATESPSCRVGDYRIVKKTLARLAVVALAFCGAHIFGILSIFYRYPVDNDPLSSPIEVIELDDDRIVLADGRTIRMYLGAAPYWINDKEAGRRVDVEVESTNRVTVFGKKRIFYCGVGDPFVVIPVIPITVARWHRASVASGEIDGLPRTDTNCPCSHGNRQSANGEPSS